MFEQVDFAPLHLLHQNTETLMREAWTLKSIISAALCKLKLIMQDAAGVAEQSTRSEYSLRHDGWLIHRNR